MPDALGLRAEAHGGPGQQKNLPVWYTKAKKHRAKRDPAHCLALYLFLKMRK